MQVVKKISYFLTLIMLMFGSFFGSILPLIAAETVTDAYDIPTTIKTSDAANHDIYITVPSAIPEGDAIALTFETGFDLTEVNGGDMDLLDDGVQMTLNETCSAAYNANVGVAGQTITFTICAGGGGAIAAGSAIRIRIGTNALDDGGGGTFTPIGGASGQISNPTTTGTYYIGFETTTNDMMASIPIPIISDDDSGVSATTPTPPSTGTSGPGTDPFDPDDSITISSPNGGEVYSFGDMIEIDWSTEGTIPFVNIRYSADNGNNYLPIAEGLINNGSYTWETPEIDSDEMFIRVEGTDLATIIDQDESDTSFAIQGPIVPFVTILSPNGGEQYTLDDTITLLWDASDTFDNFRIESFNDGEISVLRNGITSDEFSSKSIEFPASEIGVGDFIHLRVGGLIGEPGSVTLGDYDRTDTAFSIIETPLEINIASPNGGEFWVEGSQENILWSKSDAIATTDIHVSYNDSDFSLLAGGLTTDNYTWTIPDGVATELARIKLIGFTDDGGQSVEAQSESVFTILSPEQQEFSVSVLSPNGGEELIQGQTYLITWNATGAVDSFDVFYSLNGGINRIPIIIGATGTSHLWTVPEQNSDEGYIYIDGLREGGIVANDSSDDAFFIRKPTETEEEEEIEEEIEVIDADGGSSLLASSVSVAGGAIQMNKTHGQYQVLNHSTITVTTSADVSLRNVRYVLEGRSIVPEEIDAGLYQSSFAIGSDATQVSVLAETEEGEIISEIVRIFPISRGYIYEEREEGAEQAIAEAIIIVFQSGAQWNAGSYAQSNPLITGEDGVFGWYVPNGDYIITGARDGYEDAQQSVHVTNNILNPSFELTRVKEPEEDILVLPGIVGDITKDIQQGFDQVFEIVNTFRDSPIAQTSAEVSKPIVIATVATSAVVLSTSFNLLPFLQYLFTFPAMLLARRRRQNFGVVYNAVTKVPIGFAIVRLFTLEGRLVKSMATDELGRYFFKVSPGRYRISVRKEDMVFPSRYLANTKQDGQYLDIYTHGEIVVTEQDVILAANIPIDPPEVERAHAPTYIQFKRFLKVLQLVLSPIGFLLAIYVFIVQPSLITAFGVIVQSGFYIVTKILIKPVKKRGWGIVRDVQTHVAIPNAIIRLFEPKFNKLIETQVTDHYGRYAFMAGANEYYLTAQKDGYAPEEVRNIDYKKKKEPSPITIDVGLKKAV